MSVSTSGYNEWYDYLFGNIVSVTFEDLLFITFTALLVLLLFWIFYKEFLSVSFDEEYAKVSGVSIRQINFLFSLLVSLTIAMSMKVVGILLVGALVSLPAAAALQFSKSFKQILIWSVLLGESAVFIGVFFSYQLNIATGGMIVVSSVFILLITLLIKRVTRLNI